MVLGGGSGGTAEEMERTTSKVYGSLVDRREAERLERLTAGLSESAPPWAAKYVEKAAPAIGVIGAVAQVIGPIVLDLYTRLYTFWAKLPHSAASCLWGLGMCFFGGRYPLSLAALEAFKLTGGSEMAVHLVTLKESLAKLQKANAEDDKKDADKDGVPDVQQIDPKQLVLRKATLALKTVDPGVVQEAVGGLWSGYLGVIAALKLKYARTTALAHSIGDAVRPAASKLLGPTALSVTPQEYRQWVSPGLNVVCKFFGMAIAWRLHGIVGKVQSSLVGGLLASRAALAMLQDAKLVDVAASDTMADEAVGWSLAAAGIYHQLVRGGELPALMTPIFWPANVLESWLQWSVTLSGGKGGAP